MLQPLFIDLSTGSFKAKSVAPFIFDFDVTDEAGQTNFTFTAGIMTDSSYVEALINGREYREGASFDFQRDVSNHRLTFSYAVAKNAWVRIKIYPFGVAA